jgi:hypothetical protein
MRNSPGLFTGNGAGSELDRFLTTLTSLMGFPSMEKPESESGIPRTDFETRKTGRGMQKDEVTRYEESTKRVCMSDTHEV